MNSDIFGNRISAETPTDVQGINDFILGYIGYDTRLIKILSVAEQSTNCLVNVYAGLLLMLSETGGVPEDALRFRDKAVKTGKVSLPRERLLLDVLNNWIDDRQDDVLIILEQILSNWPRDVATLKLKHYFDFTHGRFEDMLHATQCTLTVAPEIPALYGMLAFAFEQCHDLDAAEVNARKALAMDPAEPWSQHALAHVLLTRGKINDGIDFLEKCSCGWGRLTSFMYTHLWWHLALFYLAAGRCEAAVGAYDQHCWARERSFSQDQIGAVSLLIRLELAGVDVGGRWDELGRWLSARKEDVSQPFLTLHYLYGLLRAGRVEGDLLLAHIVTAGAKDNDQSRGWTDVGIPLAQGIKSYLRGEYQDARDFFDRSMPALQSIGGSHAQRDLFVRLHNDIVKKTP